MKPLSEIIDLKDPSGRRNAHSKVMILCVTATVLLIVGLVLVLDARHLAWPDVAALGLLLVAPYGLDGYKTLLKLRSEIPDAAGGGATIGTTPMHIRHRRGTGAAEGVEPTP